MVEAQKDERKENRGDRRFIQRVRIADILPKRKDIRIADIIRSDMCSNADIPKLYEIPNPAFKNKRYLSRFNLTYERKNCYGKQNKNL